jgi:hypothetical protein
VHETIRIERLDGGPLELDGWGLASAFFTTDPRSVGVGSYDSLCGKGRLDRIEIPDIETLNRTMRARTPHDRWASITDRRLLWLDEIDPDIDLIETDDAAWPLQVQSAAYSLRSLPSSVRGGAFRWRRRCCT